MKCRLLFVYIQYSRMELAPSLFLPFRVYVCLLYQVDFAQFSPFQILFFLLRSTAAACFYRVGKFREIGETQGCVSHV